MLQSLVFTVQGESYCSGEVYAVRFLVGFELPKKVTGKSNPEGRALEENRGQEIFVSLFSGVLAGRYDAGSNLSLVYISV